jgi:hypothetical protein
MPKKDLGLYAYYRMLPQKFIDLVITYGFGFALVTNSFMQSALWWLFYKNIGWCRNQADFDFFLEL